MSGKTILQMSTNLSISSEANSSDDVLTSDEIDKLEDTRREVWHFAELLKNLIVGDLMADHTPHVAIGAIKSNLEPMSCLNMIGRLKYIIVWIDCCNMNSCVFQFSGKPLCGRA